MSFLRRKYFDKIRFWRNKSKNDQSVTAANIDYFPRSYSLVTPEENATGGNRLNGNKISRDKIATREKVRALTPFF